MAGKVIALALASKGLLKSGNFRALGSKPIFGTFNIQKCVFEERCRAIHFSPFLNAAEKAAESGNPSAKSEGIDAKIKKKKLKGKRAVVKWLKRFRDKKKREYERMTPEEKVLYKLNKARKKEERLVEALKKLEPKETSETTHDPEILTPEEHFFFLKMGLKCKNYVPIGRRGIYQGVILNMHLHWKKHQTLQVVVKTFTPDEVKEIASELARLSGGIVLDIIKENTIIMYRGKNYSQPPTEIMSPRVTLGRKKALDKSKYRDALRAVRKYVPRLEQDLELVQAHALSKADTPADAVEEFQKSDINSIDSISTQSENSAKLKEIIDNSQDNMEDDLSSTDTEFISDSEDLSDIFETDSEMDAKDENNKPLYLETFEKFPVKRDMGSENLEEQLREISRKEKLLGSNDEDSPKYDEVDRMFLRGASLLTKNGR
ncbi:hypothetical protein ACFE04_001985 [Oxalis oulophora]